MSAISEQVAVRPSPEGSAAPPPAIARDFHPGWYGAVMGTGIVAVAAVLFRDRTVKGKRSTRHG